MGVNENDDSIRSASTEKSLQQNGMNDHYVQGEVHDEKALHLGGASGSAGVFSTARAMSENSGDYFLVSRNAAGAVTRD